MQRHHISENKGNAGTRAALLGFYPDPADHRDWEGFNAGLEARADNFAIGSFEEYFFVPAAR